MTDLTNDVLADRLEYMADMFAVTGYSFSFSTEGKYKGEHLFRAAASALRARPAFRWENNDRRDLHVGRFKAGFVHFEAARGFCIYTVMNFPATCGECFETEDEAKAALEAHVADALGLSLASDQPSFQSRVQPWMMACFGPDISADRVERNHRFLEEALELVQACGCTKTDAHALVDYVYDRPQGDINQEVGGVMVTLAALCLANGFDMHEGGETELARIWTKIEQIRGKQATKPRGPLPQAVSLASDHSVLVQQLVDTLAYRSCPARRTLVVHCVGDPARKCESCAALAAAKAAGIEPGGE